MVLNLKKQQIDEPFGPCTRRSKEANYFLKKTRAKRGLKSKK